MMRLIFRYNDEALRAVRAGADIEAVCESPVHERIARAKTVPEADYKTEFAKIEDEITAEMDLLIKQASEEE